MSKAVSISEGGKGRIFPQTDKLKINNVGGGNSLWLPEDEVVTGTLYADENGIYLAENDGFSCYDTVVVRVEDETDPDEEDWDLELDELDEDVWDEESLEEFQEDPEAFEEKFNDKEKWKAEKAKKEKSQKIKKVKSLKPSKITGIDPVDGNPYQVGVDSEGNLTKEMLPSSIHIVVPPWKREYENGEEINFYGMHVYLLDKDGHPFKSEKYPTGEIPFEELLLPVTVADKDGSSEEIIYPDYLDHGTVKVGSVGSISSLIDEMLGYFPNGYRDPHGFIDQIKMFVSSFEGIHPVVIDVDTKNIRYYGWSPFSVNVFTSIKVGDDIILGHNYNTISYSTFGSQFPDEPMEILEETARDSASRLILGSIDHNTFLVKSSLNAQVVGGANVIPVQWMRSDGEMLEDNFTISISAIDDTGSWGDSTDPINVNESGHTSGGF